MWDRLVEQLSKLFGRGGNTKTQSRPGQSGPELQPSSFLRTRTTEEQRLRAINRLDRMNALPYYVRNSTDGKVVRQVQVERLARAGKFTVVERNGTAYVLDGRRPMALPGKLS